MRLSCRHGTLQSMKDAKQPATKGDLAALQQRLDKKFATKSDLLRLEQAIAAKLEESTQEILHHFDAAVENIEHDLKGAGADELSSLHDRVKGQESRLRTVEERLGIPPAG